MTPLLITAPHCTTTLPQKFREKIMLSEYEIWQFSDPFTDELFYPEAVYVLGELHRALIDFNRDSCAKDLFRKIDFYGRQIWKEGMGLNEKEKENLIKSWKKFREKITQELKKFKEKGYKTILHIDHHNIASDHQKQNSNKIPHFNLGNYGNCFGEEVSIPITARPKIIQTMQKNIKDNFSTSVQLNHPYQGSSLLRYVQSESHRLGIEVQSVLLEWDLSLVWNPKTKEKNEAQLNTIMQVLKQSTNEALKILE